MLRPRSTTFPLDIMRTTGYVNMAHLEANMKDLAQFFKVLADEARLKMLWLLFNHRELCVCDIMEALGVTQSKASRHLAALRHAGLVVDRKAGAWSYYSLRPIENGLERAQLDTLRAQLANHTGAARVLRDLHEWMVRKEGDAACSVGAARRATATIEPAGRARVPLTGGNR
jgi:ArsR family transcriptional regulator